MCDSGVGVAQHLAALLDQHALALEQQGGLVVDRLNPDCIQVLRKDLAESLDQLSGFAVTVGLVQSPLHRKRSLAGDLGEVFARLTVEQVFVQQGCRQSRAGEGENGHQHRRGKDKTTQGLRQVNQHALQHVKSVKKPTSIEASF